LLIGEVGLAKSLLLKRGAGLVPNSRYESGQNSSGKSLTAIVAKEDDVGYVLRMGPVVAAKGSICAINEIGRMDLDDQKHLLDVLQEQYFTINKYGINAHIESPTAIIASANPLNGKWNDPEKIDLDEFPMLKPLIDRFPIICTFKKQLMRMKSGNMHTKSLSLKVNMLYLAISHIYKSILHTAKDSGQNFHTKLILC
jgi:DNA replicative helicase MCM subunit Mcm2 (Cdc46/Mcm family)